MSPASPLLCQSLRYLTGEMTVEECAGFEELLESNADARSALAEGVQLSAALLTPVPVAVRPVSLTPTRRGKSLVGRITVLGLSLLFVLAGRAYLTISPPGALTSPRVTPVSVIPPDELRELIGTWSDQSLLDERANDERASIATQELVAAPLEVDSGALPQAVEIPDWLLAAVCIEAEDGELCDPDLEEQEAL